jgi:pimeloyl-ACP methyl ester carboxylesterase
MKAVASADGITIAYDQSGEGVAMSAATSRSLGQLVQAWPAAALAPHFTAVSYDRRGRGDSTDTAPYAIEREVEDLGSLIGALGGSANAFGHSSGAALALEAAASGLAISGLAAFEPPEMLGIMMF